jgi:ribosomal protein L37AE/L43A
MVGGGMMNFVESVKIPFSCYDCGTIGIKNIYSPSNKCSKCRKEMVMYGKKVKDIYHDEYRYSVFDWRMGSFGDEGYVLMNEDYQCPKCKKMSLKFETNGMWD